jgi:hypothetical protein
MITGRGFPGTLGFDEVVDNAERLVATLIETEDGFVQEEIVQILSNIVYKVKDFDFFIL